MLHKTKLNDDKVARFMMVKGGQHQQPNSRTRTIPKQQMPSLFQESKLNKNDSTKDVKFQQQNSLRSIQNSQENYTKSS